MKNSIAKEDHGAQDQEGKKLYRSLPRRRKESKDEPIFIRKTYEMISACNPEVACWTEDGKSFFIKDPQRLASDMIPHYFKHSKFSSFVRQLNFYGFRKVKSDHTILINNIPSEWWEFHHPKFQKHNPKLLCEIKRASHYEDKHEAPENKKEQQEISFLRNEVNQLKSALHFVTNQLSELRQVVETLKDNCSNITTVNSMTNKRKRTPSLSMSPKFVKEEIGVDTCTGSLQDFDPQKVFNRSPSFSSESFSDLDPFEDEALITDLLDMELEDVGQGEQFDGAEENASLKSAKEDNSPTSINNQLIPEPIQIKSSPKTCRRYQHDTISLPKQKETNLPELSEYALQNCDLSSLISSLHQRSGPPLAPVAFPLASATLAAFFTKLASHYSEQSERNEIAGSSLNLQSMLPLCAT